MSALVPYSADDVLADFGGFQLHGFEKGTFVNVKPNADVATLKKGSDGEGMLVVSNDSSATIEITLLQDSAANDYLSAQAAALKARAGGILPFMLKDLTGRTLHTAERCWVKTMPSTEYSDEGNSRVWVLETDQMQFLVGGRG
jgi:hypothetical protein